MTTPKKFAFLVHLRSSYRADLAYMAKPLGLVPDAAYRFLLRNRPVKPFVWSEVTLTPGVTEPEGYIIMLPYTGRQLLEQSRQMLPLVEDAMELAANKGAEIFGLGALSSPITLGGTLVKSNPYISVTNGNAYTAVITFQKIQRLLQQVPLEKPTVALVGASGSVGSLVCQLMAQDQCAAHCILMARNERKLAHLSAQMQALHAEASVTITTNMADVKRADIVVLLTSAADNLLQSHHLKYGAIVLDDTQPRNTSPALLARRPDVSIVDGGLVSVPGLRFHQHSIALPKGISFACLAETMLLAKTGHQGHFSIGSPSLAQANYVGKLAANCSHLGFGLAPDHCFGKPVHSPVVDINMSATKIQSLQVA